MGAVEVRRCELPHEHPAHSDSPDGGFTSVHCDGVYHPTRTVLSAVEAADVARPLPQWSAEYKLRHLLARPDLAKRVVSYLPPAVAAELADRLSETVTSMVEAEVRRIHEDIQQATSVTLARLAADADRKRKELTDERFANPSRLD